MSPTDAFLAALAHDRLTFQTFKDNEAGPPPIILHGPHHALTRKLHDLNSRGAGIFLMVNHGDLQGRRAQNVTAITAYFADLDGAPIPPCWPAPPTALIESSPGRYHVYWRVTGAPLDQFERVQKHIALLLDSDPKVCDLPRVMRLPGYLHQKAKPFTTRILQLDPDAVYSHEDMIERLAVPRAHRPLPPAAAAYVASHQKRRHEHEPRGIDGALDRVRTAREGNRNDTLFRIASAIANDVQKGKVTRDEAETQLLAAANEIGLPDFEARATIRSAMRYAT